MSQPDLFDLYNVYCKGREPPWIFHRWCLTATVGAWLGRQVWLPFGSSRIFPNQYVMLVGDPGSRKSTAIKMATHIIRSCGYDKFSAQRTSKEKFLLDLAGDDGDDALEFKPGGQAKARLDDLSILDTSGSEPKETFIDADEFNNFMGAGNLEFQSILGELWDWDNTEVGYKFRLKNSRSLDIFQPTISILGGNTPTNFALCFPPVSIGQGFMSRLLLVHGDSTGRKIAFPDAPPEELKEEIMRRFMEMRKNLHGPMRLSAGAKHVLQTIYGSWPDLEDQRFKSYSTRRYTHLLKLSIVYAATRVSSTIEEEDAIYANTVLAHAETLMPKALGELGKSRNSEAANKIMQALFSAKEPMEISDLWKVARMDLEKPTDLSQVLSNLAYAEQIQEVNLPGSKKKGFLPKQKGINRKVLFVNREFLRGKELP